MMGIQDGTAYSSGAHGFTPDFKQGPPSLVLCVMFSRSSCFLFLSTIVLCVPLITPLVSTNSSQISTEKWDMLESVWSPTTMKNKKFHSIISRSNVMYIFHYSAQQTTVSFWEVFVPLFTIQKLGRISNFLGFLIVLLIETFANLCV